MNKVDKWKAKVLSNSLMGLGAGAVLVIVSIVRVGFLARGLEVSDYGNLVITLNFFPVIALFLRPGISDLLYRYLSESKEATGLGFRSALIFLTYYLSLACAIIVTVLILGLGIPLTEVLYQGRPIYALLVTLLPFVILDQFNETSSTLLRIRNRFEYVVFPPVIGALASLGWVWHAKENGFLDTRQAVLAIGGGQLISTLICQSAALIFERKELIITRENLSLRPLRSHWQSIRPCLFQTSLIRYLNAASDQGGIFLLGIFGTASQVAIFGMAYQLTRPLALFQSTVGNAISPEVHKFIRLGEYQKVARLCRNLILIGIPSTVIAGFISWGLGPALISWFLKPDYLPAVPVLTILLLASGSMIAFMPFMPVAVALDQLKWRNFIVAIRIVYLLIAFSISPTALSFAIVLLAGSITIRLCNDWPLYRRLKAAG